MSVDDPVRWVTDITTDAVRHFAWGVGDDNALWLDPDHGRHSTWSSALAPPCMLYAVHPAATSARGEDPLRSSGTTATWMWFDLVRHGDEISAHAAHDGEVHYRNQHGALVATVITRPPTQGGAPGGPDGETGRPEPHRYGPAELVVIEEAVLAESRRGVQPRYWEDVAVGHPLPPVIKGPLSVIDIVAWYAGAQGAHLRALAADDGEMRRLGTGAVLQQRVAWAQHMLSNWIGDGGFLHTCEVRFLADTPLGDTTWWSGSVRAKSQRDAARLVDLEIHAVNQRGDTTARGRALAALPSRHDGRVELPITPGESPIQQGADGVG